MLNHCLEIKARGCYIYVIYRLPGPDEKNCARGLENGPSPKGEGRFQDRGHSFSHPDRSQSLALNLFYNPEEKYCLAVTICYKERLIILLGKIYETFLLESLGLFPWM